MKIYSITPKKEVIIVKKDNGEYEWWLITPTMLGEGRKLGNMRYDVDGHTLSNLGAATRHICESHGLLEFMDDRRGERPRRKIAGLDLLQRGQWHKFAELRKLDIRNVSLLQQDYYLTPQEEKQIEAT